MIPDIPYALLTKTFAHEESTPNYRGRSPPTQHNSGKQMITCRPAIAATAAVALLFSTASIGANRAAAVTARNAAKSGPGAKLGASLAVLQKAAEKDRKSVV